MDRRLLGDFGSLVRALEHESRPDDPFAFGPRLSVPCDSTTRLPSTATPTTSDTSGLRVDPAYCLGRSPDGSAYLAVDDGWCVTAAYDLSPR